MAGARRRDAPTGWPVGVRRSPEGRSLLEPTPSFGHTPSPPPGPLTAPKLSVPSPNLSMKKETTPVGLHRIPGATEQQGNMGDAECAGDAPQAVHEVLLRSGKPMRPACGTAVPSRQRRIPGLVGKLGRLTGAMPGHMLLY